MSLLVLMNFLMFLGGNCDIVGVFESGDCIVVVDVKVGCCVKIG